MSLLPSEFASSIRVQERAQSYLAAALRLQAEEAALARRKAGNTHIVDIT